MVFVIAMNGGNNHTRYFYYAKHNGKGKHYWLYYSINKQNSLGILYGLNLTFFIATISFMLFAITLGYIRGLQLILFAFSVVLCVIEIPCMIIASIHSNKEEYGKPFVFLAKRKHIGGYASSLIEWLSWAMTAFLIYLSFQQLWLYTFLLFLPCICTPFYCYFATKNALLSTRWKVVFFIFLGVFEANHAKLRKRT